MRPPIDAQRPSHQNVVGQVAAFARRHPGVAAAPSDGSDSGDQLAEPERLDHVVIGTQFETEYTVEFLAARRDHDDRHRGPRPKLATHVVPVHVGQAQVEQHDVTNVSVHRCRPGGDVADFETLTRQRLDERAGNRLVILNQQYLHAAIIAGRGRFGVDLGRFLDGHRPPLRCRFLTVQPDPRKDVPMKARIATAISVAGVLIAGTAAAAVNTTILDGGTPSGAASQAVLPPAATVDVTIPTTAAPSSESSSSSTSLPTTSLPNNTTPTSSTVPGGSTSGGSSLTGMLTAFTVGSAGVVTVDVVSGHVVFVSATQTRAGS